MKRMVALLLVLMLPVCAYAETFFPRHFEDQYESRNGKVRIVINADVVVPQAEVFPQYSVKRRIFTDDEIRAMADACFGMNNYSVLDEYGNPVNPQPASLLSAAGTQSDMYSLIIGNEEGHISIFYRLTPDSIPFSVKAMYNVRTNSAEQFVMGANDEFDTLPNAIGTLELADASNQATAIAHSICPDWEIACIEAYPTVTYTDTSSLDYSSEQVGTVYVFHFTRSFGNAHVTYEDMAEGTHVDGQNDNYTIPFGYERFWIAINQNGVLGMQYSSPYQIGNIVGTDTQLISFESVCSVVETTLPLKYAASKRPGEIVINVERIVLGYTRVHSMNDKEQYVLIPVWDFMGSVSYADGYTVGGQNSSLLCINAETGLIIDRDYGY